MHATAHGSHMAPRMADTYCCRCLARNAMPEKSETGPDSFTFSRHRTRVPTHRPLLLYGMLNNGHGYSAFSIPTCRGNYVDLIAELDCLLAC